MHQNIWHDIKRSKILRSPLRKSRYNKIERIGASENFGILEDHDFTSSQLSRYWASEQETANSQLAFVTFTRYDPTKHCCRNVKCKTRGERQRQTCRGRERKLIEEIQNNRNVNTLCRYVASFAYYVLLCNLASYVNYFMRKVQVKLAYGTGSATNSGFLTHEQDTRSVCNARKSHSTAFARRLCRSLTMSFVIS